MEDHYCCDCNEQDNYEAGYDQGRYKMREDVRIWLDSKSAGVTPGRLLEDLDREVPLDPLVVAEENEQTSETTEQEHSHECPRCGPWIHMDDECQDIYGRRSIAYCPLCQEN